MRCIIKSTKFFLCIICIFYALGKFAIRAEDNTFIKEQVNLLNKVLSENSQKPDDPKASFSADAQERVLTLIFERNNKSLTGVSKESFDMISSMLPNVLMKTVYIETKGILNGAITGNRFIEQLKKDGYRIKVIIKGSDKQFEFYYPASILSL